MKIGFDARLINETGVGRYITNILPHLIKINKKNTWYILVRPSEKKFLTKIIPKGYNVNIIEFNYRWHGFGEQVFLPFKLYKLRLDIFHTPYINVPVFYFKRKAVTIHDLTVLHIKTGKASTKGMLFYSIKRFGYKIALYSALRSQVIFVVTNSVKQDILENFKKIKPSKIIVAYNGFTKFKSTKTKKILSYINFQKPYFLYVGNAHPHKNLEFLIDTLNDFFSKIPKYKLVIAGKNDFFMDRISKSVSILNNKNNFSFVLDPTDAELLNLYKEAACIILPSKKEGFGLQILEAMQAKTLILASKIPAYCEVAKDMAYYFSPDSKRSFFISLTKLLKTNSLQKQKLYKKYEANLKRYSWENSAYIIYNSYLKEPAKTKSLVSKNLN